MVKMVSEIELKVMNNDSMISIINFVTPADVQYLLHKSFSCSYHLLTFVI